MGLFDKKYCAICGEKIGFLGNKKLEDGDMCGKCQRKLSPWFSERRHSTVAEIKEQLAYREANEEKVAAFAVTRSFGQHTQILADEIHHQLIVTDSSNWRERNPDVLSYDQVTGCDTNIREKKEELMTKDADGKEKSYTPPRYSYEYDFCMTLYLRSPYFDHVFFELISNVKEEPPALGFLVPNWHSDAYKKAEAELKEAEEFIRGLNAPAENPQ